MYLFIKNSEVLGSYKSIRNLYYTEFIAIVLNFNFHKFELYLKEYQIYDLVDHDSLKIGVQRGELTSEDEIELLDDIELLTLLNKCLVNGFKIEVK